MEMTRSEESANPLSQPKGVGQPPFIINLNVYALSLSTKKYFRKFKKLFNFTDIILITLQKRRDKINQRMKTLQKLVPNSSKVRAFILILLPMNL